jgi:hypothetical protein
MSEPISQLLDRFLPASPPPSRTVNGLAPVLSEHYVSARTLCLVSQDPGVNDGRGSGLTTSSG